MEAGRLVYGPVVPRRWVVTAFWGPWYSGKRLFWRVRLGAWIVCAGLASLAGWRYALLGPLVFEAAFFDYVLVEFVRHKREIQRQVQNFRRETGE
jgi:hypothetical protein